MIGQPSKQIPQLAEIYGMWHVPFWQTSWFKMVCNISALLIFAGIIYYLARTIMRRKKAALPPWETALETLKQMGNSLPSTNDETRRYYVRLTALLKSYLQKRYDRVLSSSTDMELVEQAHAHDIPNKAIDQLREVLHGAVLIQFARADARETQINCDLKHARAIIMLTTPEASSDKTPGSTKKS